MADKTRIIYTERGVEGSTSAYLTWGHNHLHQRRQFATDGVKWFYQPDASAKFGLVGQDWMPKEPRNILLGMLFESCIRRENGQSRTPTAEELCAYFNAGSMERTNKVLNVYLKGKVVRTDNGYVMSEYAPKFGLTEDGKPLPARREDGTIQHRDIDAAIKDICGGVGAVLEKEIRRVWGNMTPEEVSKFASSSEIDGGLSPYKFVKTLLLAVAADIIDKEYNAESIKKNIPKVRRIAKSPR